MEEKKKVGRPKKPESLCELVLSDAKVDFTDYTNKQLGECISTLAEMYNKLKEEKISTKELKVIRESLNKQISKLDKMLPKEENKASSKDETTSLPIPQVRGEKIEIVSEE